MQGILLQRWHLVGLQPMHDALVRRLVMQVRESERFESALGLSVAWSTKERFTSWNEWAHAAEADVMVAAVERVGEVVDPFHGRVKSLSHRSDNPSCLRLLWSGLEGDNRDQLWASEWSAQGAVFDLRSLQSWIQIAIRQANRIPEPSHPFLRNLKLPSA